MGEMTMFEHDIASAMNVPMEGIPPHWQVCFAVADPAGAVFSIIALAEQPM